jgi:hypothetical protein
MIMYMCISTILGGDQTGSLSSLGKLLDDDDDIGRAEFVFLELVRQDPFDAVEGNRNKCHNVKVKCQMFY